MKILENQKGSEKLSGLLQKTSDLSKKAVSDMKESAQSLSEKTNDFSKRALADIQKGAQDLSEKNKLENYQRRLKKYNPLFPDAYQSPDFRCPTLIMIVHDDVRRTIDVCEGAIGWLENKGGTEVLCLYDEAVEFSGLQFVPTVTNDALYYVDSFAHDRFIRVDCIFSKAHEERLAELKHVAHSLGAKRCTIEITELSREATMSKWKANMGLKMTGSKVSGSDGYEQSSQSMNDTRLSGKVSSEFEGSDTPKRPKLKWFAHDDNIKKLIDMRCKSSNTIKSETLEISGATSATMSQRSASSIDAVLGNIGVKASMSMEAKAVRENQSKLYFTVEF